ncbi:MAG: ABC-F family ATP-binding cassette domain-containing protein, partial [Rikenellaceae bacterium]|nr:ABC-F family ATP-binding cassette domain-containing protein [Rikenellaceae bacterium]
MISVDNLTVSFGGFDLLKDISFPINDRDRIGLVGKNGAGKSTLMKILCGMQQPTAGSIARSSDCTIGYLPQTMKVTDSTTLFEEAASAFSEVIELERQMADYGAQLADRSDFESEAYLKLIHDLTVATDR